MVYSIINLNIVSCKLNCYHLCSLRILGSRGFNTALKRSYYNTTTATKFYVQLLFQTIFIVYRDFNGMQFAEIR